MLALVLIGIGFTFGNWLGRRLSAGSLDGATALFLAREHGIAFIEAE